MGVKYSINDFRHDLICPWCGKDHLTIVVCENKYRYGLYKVMCPRCHHYVYLSKGNSMREWADYCIDIINSCCKYPPDMADMLKKEIVMLGSIKNISPENLLNIMKKYQNVLEVNAMSKDETENNENEEVDMVNHPSHYETGKYECIEVMVEAIGAVEVMNFCLCNAFKYLYRCRRKNGLEDIKKAKWYIDKFIELLEDFENEDN